MFFGLTNSPATFQTMMDEIFQEEIAQGWLRIYMDDALIATEDDKADHGRKVNHFLSKLAEHDLYLKPEKCKFYQNEVEYLGVVIGGGNVKMDPPKSRIAAGPPHHMKTRFQHSATSLSFVSWFLPQQDH
jgi:hypothetical protein